MNLCTQVKDFFFLNIFYQTNIYNQLTNIVNFYTQVKRLKLTFIFTR